MNNLKNQLETVMDENKFDGTEVTRYPTETDVSKWTEDDVENWSKSLKLHPGLRASLKSCNGTLLREIYDMRQEAPQFLLDLMTSKIGENAANRFFLSDFNFFSRELNSLFSTQSK